MVMAWQLNKLLSYRHPFRTLVIIKLKRLENYVCTGLKQYSVVSICTCAGSVHMSYLSVTVSIVCAKSALSSHLFFFISGQVNHEHEHDYEHEYEHKN